ncbi:hypothetical protein V2J09_023110 [Rumex salicifolius]
MGPPLPSVYQENCLSMMPPFLKFNPSASSSCSFLDPSMGSSFLHGSLNAPLGVENMMFVGSEMQPKDESSSGMFCQDQLHRVYNSSDSQSISNDNNQQLVNGAVSTPPLSTEISNMEDSAFKPGKLSAEQRKEKIQRYMKKRNERNFSKKIKYACRKTLADSRPRVRGRFAKNDDSGDAHRHINGLQEDDEFDDVHACVSTLLHYRNF